MKRFLKPKPSRRRAFVTNLLDGNPCGYFVCRHERDNDHAREVARRLMTEPVVGGVRIVRKRIGNI